MVIVSKPSPIIASPAGTVQANKSSQPPLIVFDLGQQHHHQHQQQQQLQQIAKEETEMKNNVLSDILKSTGIIEEERVPIVVPDSSTPPPLQAVDPAQGKVAACALVNKFLESVVVAGSSEKNNGKSVDEKGPAAVAQEAEVQDEFVADTPKITATGRSISIHTLIS